MPDINGDISGFDFAVSVNPMLFVKSISSPTVLQFRLSENSEKHTFRRRPLPQFHFGLLVFGDGVIKRFHDFEKIEKDYGVETTQGQERF